MKNYSKKEIGLELKDLLKKTYSIEEITVWAENLFISLRDEPLPEVDFILDRISLMGAGPEFEYTEEEMNLLAEMLINEKEDPIKQLNDIIAKKSYRRS